MLLKILYKKLVYKKDINIYINSFKNKDILEIGGPSSIFDNKRDSFFPIYDKVRQLSNINFSYHTIWENKITEGNTFKYGERIGNQYVLEASDLNTILDNQYDGIISSHCLEHTANPIKVILEWKRVIKKSGYLLIIVPNKKYTFDHKRPYTQFEHILSDYNNQVTEEDLTHLDEIMELHDQVKDVGLNGVDLRERCLQNFKNRCMHQHVFNDELIAKIAEYTDLELVQKNTFYIHLAYLLRKK